MAIRNRLAFQKMTKKQKIDEPITLLRSPVDAAKLGTNKLDRLCLERIFSLDYDLKVRKESSLVEPYSDPLYL